MQQVGYSNPVKSREEANAVASQLINGVYVWMALGVLTTAIIGWGLYSSGAIISLLRVAGRGFMWGVFFAQIGAVIAFSGAIRRMSVGVARGLFFLYSAITGLTLAVVCLIYTISSILSIFALACLAFGGLALFGAVTKRNLGPIGTFCVMGFFMILGLQVFYMLCSSFGWLTGYLETFNMTIGIAGIFIFSGLTAWESQKIRAGAYSLATSGATHNSMESFVTAGAFTMYINFINLFFSLLRVFGGRR